MVFRISSRLVIGFMMLFPFILMGQNSPLGNWLIYFGNYQVDSRWNLHHEIQYRNYNAVGDLEQLLIRTGVGYNLTPDNNNLLMGYGYILSEPYRESGDKFQVHEHRIFQQFITVQRHVGVQVQHRYRLEQRWVEDDFRLRFRYFLSLHIPLVKGDSYPYASAYNEVFLQPEDVVFDRNRLYLGAGYKWNSQVKAEVGYMNQFFSEDGRDQINLILFLGF